MRTGKSISADKRGLVVGTTSVEDTGLASVPGWIKTARRYPAQCLQAKASLAASLCLITLAFFLRTGGSIVKVFQYLGTVQTLIALGIASGGGCAVYLKNIKHDYDAALEGMAHFAGKEHLGTLLPFLPAYDASQQFDRTLEELFNTITEADAGIFSRSQQSFLVRCFVMFNDVRTGTQARDKRRVSLVLLHALALIGDRESLVSIQRAVGTEAQLDVPQESAHAVRTELSTWRDRLSRLETAKTLLRASNNSDYSMLVMPVAAASAEQEAEQLLRAGTAADRTPLT